MESLPERDIHIIVFGFTSAFLLAFGLGANDVANSFATSVGSGVLTLKSACLLATICEISGAVLLGTSVSKTIRGGIVDLSMFNGTRQGIELLKYGQISALSGACIWLILATLFKIPVSGTHSIVGATAGYGLVVFGIKGVKWHGFLKIVISWFISPLLSGALSTLLFFCIKHFVLKQDKPLEPALASLPFLYGLTILINVFTVGYGGLTVFNAKKLSVWIVVAVSMAAGIVTSVFVFFVVNPYLRKRITRTVERKRLHETEGWDAESVFSSQSQVLTFIQHVRLCLYNALGLIPRHEHVKPVVIPLFEIIDDSNTTSTSLPSKVHIKVPENTSKSNALRSSYSESERLRTINSTNTTPDKLSPMHLSMFAKRNDSNANQAVLLSPTYSEKVEGLNYVETLSFNRRMFIKDRPEEAEVFCFAQILTATFGSFAHGGNDVSNAIGPLIGLYVIMVTGEVDTSKETPIWLLLYGGVGMSVGLWVLGRRVIETIGEDLTTITPSSGVCIEVGSAMTVLIASKIGIPISTTHCKVGSVVCVGRFRSSENVNWRLFCNIIVAWVVTLPIAGGISALVMFCFMKTS